MTLSALNYAQICSMLPQGRAMLLVDKVISLQTGNSIVGLKTITATDPCYAAVPASSTLDCFKYPVSLLVESFGQTAAILWLLTSQSEHLGRDRVLMFAGARNFRIEGHAYPGDVLRHVARLDHMRDDTVFVNGETWVDDRRIATIESMIAAARPRSIILNYAAASG